MSFTNSEFSKIILTAAFLINEKCVLFILVKIYYHLAKTTWEIPKGLVEFE